MEKFLIYRGDRFSDSAFALRDALREANVPANVNALGTARRYRRRIINWGTTYPNLQGRGRTLNRPDNVADSINKLVALTKLKEEGVNVPSFSTSIDNLNRTDSIVLARTNLRGSGGAGIVVLREADDVVEAPLYVQYVPKTAEYRYHVVAGKVVFVQQKRKRGGVEQDKNQKLIRNYDNGWVFCPVLDQSPEDISREAINAVAALGLDFGAVDLIIGRDDFKPYVLEVNTAPGLESPQLKAAYAQAFKELASGIVLPSSS
jgi:glutathione synthase/RimK-type ligase-like ATP-grasp enzyme